MKLFSLKTNNLYNVYNENQYSIATPKELDRQIMSKDVDDVNVRKLYSLHIFTV